MVGVADRPQWTSGARRTMSAALDHLAEAAAWGAGLIAARAAGHTMMDTVFYDQRVKVPEEAGTAALEVWIPIQIDRLR